jgi:Fe-S cluster assembly protein SufB
MTNKDQTSNDTDYKYGFSSDLDQEIFPVGINEEVIRQISTKKNEPKWLLEYRLKAFEFWQKSKQPNWANLNIAPIDYQAISYFAEVKKPEKSKSIEAQKQEWLDELEG